MTHHNESSEDERGVLATPRDDVYVLWGDSVARLGLASPERRAGKSAGSTSMAADRSVRATWRMELWLAGIRGLLVLRRGVGRRRRSLVGAFRRRRFFRLVHPRLALVRDGRPGYPGE